MKKIKEKIIVTLLIVFMVLNNIIPNLVYASLSNDVYNAYASEINKMINEKMDKLLEGKTKDNTTEAEKEQFASELQKFASTISLDVTKYESYEMIKNDSNVTSADIEKLVLFLSDCIKVISNNSKTLIENKLEGTTETTNMLVPFEPSISLEQAKNYLITKLGTLKVNKEKELQNQDANTKTYLLQQYFQELKSDYQQARGDFYNEVIKIANRIVPESDKDEFLENVPDYIQEYINSQLGQTITVADLIWNLFSVTTDAVAGILLYRLKVFFLILPGTILETIETSLASIGTENGVLGIDKFLKVDHIFFNEVALVDINIFDFETAANSKITGNNVLLNIRKNVAGWYVAIRNLSIVLGLAVLIYIGIRMATSAIADDKARYKKMLQDWLVSFALIFVLQYFMVFVIQLNDGIIDVLAKAKDVQEEDLKINFINLGNLGINWGINEGIPTGTIQSKLLLESFHPLFTRGVGSAVLYVMLVAMTFLFLIVYIKRFVTICFLAMISPLITITYAIDKAGDGKAQALNKWMKEFVFNVLIQPFHCIIYMVFLQNIFYVINDTSGVLQIGKIFVAIIMLGFIFKSEDIVKAIFGFEAHNLSSAAMLGAAAMSKASKVGKIKSTMSGVKGAGEKAAAVKNIQTPNSLPSSVQNAPATGNASQLQTPQLPQNAQSPQTNKSKLLHQYGYGNGKADEVARKLAGKALSMAVGYGLTGEYGGALGANKAAKTVVKKTDELKLSSRVKQRREEALDAYQDYKESHGLSSEEMLRKSKELLGKDIDDITDAQDRNLAGWLQADRETQRILGVDDPDKEVMNHLYDYENG